MADLAERIDIALSETRTLIIGAQVLAGVGFRAVFEKRFGDLPPLSRQIHAAALALLLAAFALLMAPAAYHRIVDGGRNSGRFHFFVTRASAAALFPFAIGLGLEAGIAVQSMLGSPAGGIAGAIAAAGALLFWYGWEAADRARGHGPRPRPEPRTDRREDTPLSERIKHVLTETRVVLPGAQALLGFQFLAMLTDPFEQLPRQAKIVHLASLISIGFATVLLMAPAAYHRIVEQGEETERFHRIASVLVVGAMVPIALGMAGDFYVVLVRVTGSSATAMLGGSIALAVFGGIWFGYSSYRRARMANDSPGARRRTATR